MSQVMSQERRAPVFCSRGKLRMTRRGGRSGAIDATRHSSFAVTGRSPGFSPLRMRPAYLALLIGVIEHLADRTAALAGVARVLRASGRLIVISPHPWNPISWIKRLWDGGRDEPPAEHPLPLQLRRVAARHRLELSAIRALPYAPWPEAKRPLRPAIRHLWRCPERCPRMGSQSDAGGV
jgi:SAM-dependent methyltransferase